MTTENRCNTHVSQVNGSQGGEISLRPMTHDDIPAGMRLSTLAGWNQTKADWELFFQYSSEGCFIAVHNDQPVGTVATLTYPGGVAWIGMVLVDPQFRRRGIGSLLLKGALAYLEGCPSIKLDATPAGKVVYDKLGFFDEYRLHRMTCSALPLIKEVDSAGILPLDENSLTTIIKLDCQIFGADRSGVLRGLLKNAPQSAFYLQQEGILRGFCLGRNGPLFHQIGPVVAETVEDARALLCAAFQGLAGRAVVMDVPDAQPQLMAWLEGLGFTKQRPFVRMYCHSNDSPGIPARQFAIAGPELG